MLKKGYSEPENSKDCLNINYHIKRLLLIAMGRYKEEKNQAKALGVSIRTLYNYRKKFNI